MYPDNNNRNLRARGHILGLKPTSVWMASCYFSLKPEQWFTKRVQRNGTRVTEWTVQFSTIQTVQAITRHERHMILSVTSSHRCQLDRDKIKQVLLRDQL